VRLAVEKRGEEYLSFPRRALFDKIGIRYMVMETDPYGNFLTQGYELAAARDWARLGNLYLQDGVWNGERILPEGFVQFVSSVAPAWAADNRPVYGGFFWINGGGLFPVPESAYFMWGAGGQYTLVIPSHELVVVRAASKWDTSQMSGSWWSTAHASRRPSPDIDTNPSRHSAGNQVTSSGSCRRRACARSRPDLLLGMGGSPRRDH